MRMSHNIAQKHAASQIRRFLGARVQELRGRAEKISEVFLREISAGLSDELDPGPLDRGDADESGSHVGPNIQRQEQASEHGVFHWEFSRRGFFNFLGPFELSVCHAVSLAITGTTSQFKDKLQSITFKNGPYFPT